MSDKKNKFSTCRFGNVTHSHGSVLPFWIRLRSQNKSLKLTSKEMNRLMFSQNDAVSLVKYAVDKTHEDGGFILSKKMKTVNMYELASIMSKAGLRIVFVGIESINPESIPKFINSFFIIFSILYFI